MLLSRLRELSAELDERVPGRAGFRHWRRTRPFWGGVAADLGGLIILLLPMAPLPVMIHVGMAAVSGVAIGSILIAAGLFFWFAPAQRAFVAVVASICALVSVVTSNLGGGGIGALLALVGSAMAFGWRTDPRPPTDPGDDETELIPPVDAAGRLDVRDGGGAPAGRADAGTPGGRGGGGVPDDRESGPLPEAGRAGLRASAPPEAGSADAVEGAVASVAGGAPRRVRWRSLVVMLPVAVAAGLVTAVAAHRPPPAEAAPAEAAPATVSTCVPVPGATRPWWIPEWLWPACPNPSTNPSAGPPNSGSPAPTPSPTPAPSGGDTTGTPVPSGSGEPGPGTSPSVSASASPSAGMTVAPRMTNPGRITAIKYGENVPAVSADRLLATGFTFRGTVELPTDSGTVKALVFHADNLKADNYRILTGDPGPDLRLGIDLDIDDVDIYATHLGGLITVPYLDVPLLPVEITADLIPTWLPLNIWLPAFSGNGVKAGQVFIRAGTVRGSHLAAEVSGSGASSGRG
ncbi:hypothetical protein Q0Z83_012570 [Actinoplanes sichuanensis]|uniref:DUF6114 domain-containing protein n=1 Tax=Actinoplanes sichuanensis TaxID=512349 RepID=A0ABW4A5Y3_9ACTN|nr:DUF6114 domain-containing protein [Actinoplanes sichuanensis]BEL03066.1 hypothetical protein Q0Z83_012570 [Actinoplanes sichuanensis]